jgi:predicted 2-oxoglutarate/Fe(II)-dependent dioxygenase YbiX
MIYQEKIFSKEECERILQLSDTLEFRDGKTRYSKDNMHADFDEYWVSDNENAIWFMDRIKVFAEKELKVKLKKLKSDVAILKYKEGQGIDMHIDYNPKNVDVRMYTVGVMLNTEWEGGEFFIKDVSNGEETMLIKEIGNTYIFDAFSPHIVNKVTKGVRCVLITHILNSEIKKTDLI